MSPALSHIGRRRSIRTQLAMGSLFFFGIVFVLGSFGIASLSYVNSLQAEIRTRWLPSTSVVGDLNNFTSDFPAAERAALLSSNGSEVAAHAAEMSDLDRAIARAEASYERLRHDSGETELYRRFSAGRRTIATSLRRNSRFSIRGTLAMRCTYTGCVLRPAITRPATRLGC